MRGMLGEECFLGDHTRRGNGKEEGKKEEERQKIEREGRGEIKTYNYGFKTASFFSAETHCSTINI